MQKQQNGVVVVFILLPFIIAYLNRILIQLKKNFGRKTVYFSKMCYFSTLDI